MSRFAPISPSQIKADKLSSSVYKYGFHTSTDKYAYKSRKKGFFSGFVEQKALAGVKAQFDSEVIYGSIKKMLSDKGVIFLGMDEGLKKYPDLVKQYFGSLIPAGDNKFAALNTAVWSGGSFVYVPKNVDVGLPLQAYFRINSP